MYTEHNRTSRAHFTSSKRNIWHCKPRVNANTPSVSKSSTNVAPGSKEPCRRPPLPWGCGEPGIGGSQKTHLHHLATATAINLQRFVDWLGKVPRSKTYTVTLRSISAIDLIRQQHIGAVLANMIGTTGASMLLDTAGVARPTASAGTCGTSRVFFIFLVSNVGGALTPIGDPPLFLGYLRGVPFFWTFTHLWPDVGARRGRVAGHVLRARHRAASAGDRGGLRRTWATSSRSGSRGAINLLLLAGVVLATGTLTPGKPFLHIEGGWEPFHFCRENGASCIGADFAFR